MRGGPAGAARKARWREVKSSYESFSFHKNWSKGMTMTPEQRLADRGLTLPNAPAPAANYVPYVLSGSHLYISGQISQGPNGLITGKVGADVDVLAAQDAAKMCALAILAQAKAALGDLGKIKQVIKLTGFVNSTPDFTDQPEVINGASDLLVDILGDAGRHARAAVSAGALPRGVAVEIDAVLEVA